MRKRNEKTAAEIGDRYWRDDDVIVQSALNILSLIASRYFAFWVLLAAVIGLFRPSTF